VRPARAVASVILGLVLMGCGLGKPAPSPSPSGIGAVVKAMEQDINVMHEANAAASEVIRAAGDCDAARPLIPAANARLDEAQRKVQTSTGRQTLDALRKKVREVAENCP
jgi:L-asparaginase/Glu-tRNA(Gln) amidotransferase subunit D